MRPSAPGALRLALEAELKGVPQNPYAIGRLMAQVLEEVTRHDAAARLWYMRSSIHAETLLLGIHSPGAEQPDLIEHLQRALNRHPQVVITAHPSGPSFHDARILKRIPCAIQSRLASDMLNGFLCGTEIALAYLSEGTQDPYQEQDAIALFCYLVSQCCHTLALSPQETAFYCNFHRDSIVRFIILRAGKGLDKAREVIRLLEANVATESLAETLRTARPVVVNLPELITYWLAEIGSAWETANSAPATARMSDPFATSSRHPVLFQFLHMVAHQLGLSLLAEAQAFSLVSPPLESGHNIPPFMLTLPTLEADPPASAPLHATPLAASHPPWMLLVEAGSEQGKGLMELFRSEYGAAYRSCSEALLLLRRHELGERRFEKAKACLEAALPVVQGGGALNALLARFFWGSLAYYQYCRGELEQSELTLNKAGEHLNKAINAETCLVPCAPLNSDIPLQRARVARRLGNWPRVASELSLLADLESGRQALLLRDDGLAITYPLLEGMFLPRFNRDDPDSCLIREYLNPHSRIRRLNQWIRGFYVQEGIVVSSKD